MEIFKEIKPLRAYLSHKRSQNISIGLVPTMGALHPGHLSLIEASGAENDLTVCSIYINPTQFNNPKDLEVYPRTLARDCGLLEEAGCSVVFIPENKEMYEKPSRIKFDFGNMDKVLEGKFRPGHFSGVALVLSKLFNIVLPQAAYFGQKDFQQFKIVSRMVEELKFDLQLRCMPIHRESDGLAMSSRNLRLNDQQRKIAIVFYQSLLEANRLFKQGASGATVIGAIQSKCEKAGARLEYIELADSGTLDPLEKINQDAILLIAGYVGEIRLIDNLFINSTL